MNASELKAICRWLATIYLLASLAQATVPLFNALQVEQSPCIPTPALLADPQQGHGN
jgi:hypothetical protein